VSIRTWKNRLAWLMAVLIIAAAVPPGSNMAILAADAGDTPYTLTTALKAGVKTVLNERVPGGVRIGAVVRLQNIAYRAIAVPGYELRAVTTDGVVYTLKASADNPRIVQPRETVELSYMLTVSRTDAFAIDRLAWVSIDEYVYPKKETTVLNMPASGLEWYGPSTVFTDARRLKDWGVQFTIPTESDALVYTAVRLAERHTPQGTTAVLVLQVRNAGSRLTWVPEFTVTGKTTKGYYPAERAESGAIAIQPGATRYLHFVMRLPGPEAWKSFTIGTPESFTDDSGTVRYEAGRLQIKPPVRRDQPSLQSSYKLLDPILVSSTYRPNLTKEVEIALAEVRRFEQAGDGYLTAVAKFRLVNFASVTVPIPDFGVEWTTSGGVSYTGERLESRQNLLMPGVGTMIAYVFTLPLSAEEDTTARLTLLDGQSDAFQLPVGAIELELEEEEEPPRGMDRLYPFDVSVRSASFDKDGRLNLEFSVARASNLTFDERTLRLRLTVSETNGRLLASRSWALAGANRLTSGPQTIELGEREDEFRGVVVRLYEVLAGPDGEIERQIGTLQVKP